MEYVTTTTDNTEIITIKAPEWDGEIPKINGPQIGWNRGWVCPRCGRVNAPWVSSCTCSFYDCPPWKYKPMIWC